MWLPRATRLCPRFPSPPPKKMFGNMNREFIEERRRKLQTYIDHVILEVASNPNLKTWGVLCDFLRVDRSIKKIDPETKKWVSNEGGDGSRVQGGGT